MPLNKVNLLQVDIHADEPYFDEFVHLMVFADHLQPGFVNDLLGQFNGIVLLPGATAFSRLCTGMKLTLRQPVSAFASHRIALIL